MLRNKYVAYPFEEYPKNRENTAQKSRLFWGVATVAIIALLLGLSGLVLGVISLRNSNNLYDRNAADRFASDVQQAQLDSILMSNSTTYATYPTTTIHPVSGTSVTVFPQLVENVDSPTQSFAVWGPDGDFSATISEPGTYCIGFQYVASLILISPSPFPTYITGSITAFSPTFELSNIDTHILPDSTFGADHFSTVPLRFTVTEEHIPIKLKFTVFGGANSATADYLRIFGTLPGVGGLPGIPVLKTHAWITKIL